MIEVRDRYVGFNPHYDLEDVRKILPHEVIIHTPSDYAREVINETLYAWCKKNCKYLFTDMYGYEDDKKVIFYLFADGKEAMHFKLIFGG